MQPAILPARQADCSGAAGCSGSRRRGCRFPQALGESPPGQAAAAAGQQQRHTLARQAALRGKRVAVLPAAAYGGHKDASAAWAAGVLAVGGRPAAAGMGGAAAPEIPEGLQELWQERAASIAADGHLPPAEAERLAWACLLPHDAGAVRAGGGPGA